MKITGGEPTCHPEFYEILEKIEKRAIPFTIFSNARWTHPEQLINFLGHSNYCEGILVSLHGADAGTHECFTGIPGSFDETVANIKRASQYGIFITISCVITEYNVGQLESVVNLTNSIGTKSVIFNRYFDPVTGQSGSVATLKQAVNAIEYLRRHSKLPVRWGNCLPQCFTFSSSTGCYAGITHCTIDPCGNVRPCNHAPLICGNILEQSIEEIWHGLQMTYWRQLIPDACYACALVEQCHGGCRAMRLIAHTETDPLMTVPISLENIPDMKEEIELYAFARPRLCAEIRREPFGLAIVWKGKFVPVCDESKSLLDKLNGSTTLAQVRNDFGEEALQFVVFLLQKGFIQLS